MAIAATGVATCAAALSGLALGATYSLLSPDQRVRLEQEREERQLLRKEAAAGAVAAAVAAATAGLAAGAAKVPGRSSSKSFAREEEALMMEEVGFEGFTMEEACQHGLSAHSMAMERRPHEILAELQRGNTRFWTSTAVRPERSAFQRRALISKQFPSVAILGCSDSRVPTEIVFDQGLGDIFVIRVAGNALEPSTLASLQYAVHHLKVKVVMVLGHEMCGAVKAAQLPMDALQEEPAELQHVLQSIKMGLDAEVLEAVQDHRALDREAVTSNVKRQVQRLTLDDGIMSKVKQKEVLIVGAFYEISSGIVDYFFEVSEPDTKVVDDEGTELRRSPSQSPSQGVISRFEPENDHEIVRSKSGGVPTVKRTLSNLNARTTSDASIGS